MPPEKKDILDKFLALVDSKILMFPAVFDYLVFDDLVYEKMCLDKARSTAYQTAIQKNVKGKKVVDIGTGATFPLARLCIESGAEIVYAIECNEEAAQIATQTIEEQGLTDKIKILVGHSTELELPEKVDVCVSEIIGNIASSEGAMIILQNDKRFLKTDGILIPQRCVTKIAPVTLPADIYTNEFLESYAQPYIDAVKKIKGEDFKFTRFEFFNMPHDCILAKEAIFEDIHFEKDMSPNSEKQLSYIFQKNADFDGFLFWIDLYLDADTVIPASVEQRAWCPIYMPASRFSVQKHDTMDIVCTTKTGKNGINPDYSIKGSIDRNGQTVHQFIIDSPH